MGDHRANIIIEFDFHGKKYRLDSWINYFPNEIYGVDDRVIELFRESYEDGMSRYEEQVAKYRTKENKKRIENEEREQLARLKVKYPDK